MHGRAGKYRFVRHTADVEFVAFGKDHESCFRNALMAMLETISDTSKVASSKGKTTILTVKDRAGGMDDLLWYALQDTLSISDSRDVFAYRIPMIKIKEGKKSNSIAIRVTCKPKLEEASRLEVKGVSRYNLSVRKGKNLIRATAVLDV